MRRPFDSMFTIKVRIGLAIRDICNEEFETIYTV